MPKSKKAEKDPGKLTQGYPPKQDDDDPEEEPEHESEPEEEAPIEEPKPAPEEPEKRACDVVGYEGTCSACGWKWGDANPHPVHVVPQNVDVPVEAVPAPPPAPELPPPDPNACPPIHIGGECSKCGWTAASGNPHPIAA